MRLARTTHCFGTASNPPESVSKLLVTHRNEVRAHDALESMQWTLGFSRPQDWIDVEKVIIRQGIRLNRPLIPEELQPLAELKEEPEILENVKRLFGSNE